MQKNDTSAFLKNFNEIVITIDRDGNILFANSVFYKLIKTDPHEIQTNCIYDYMPKDERVKLQKILEQSKSLSQKKKFLFQVNLNNVKPFFLSIYQILPDHPDIFCLILNDLTQLELIQATYASIDSLSGLTTRTVLDKTLTHAKKMFGFFAVILVDVNHFKEVNAMVGHEGGDSLLKIISAYLLEITHETDMVTRYDSDVFAIILTHATNVSEVNKFAQRILEFFDKPFIFKSYKMMISASIGISLYPSHGKNNNTLLQAANAALLKAKQVGGKHCFISTQKTSVEARKKARLKNKLFHAIHNQELLVNYQPKIDLANFQIVGVEALVRWYSPKGVSFSPSEFITLAENSDLIITLEEWVLEQVCQDLAKWREAQLSIANVSVNLSPRHLKKKAPLEFIKNLLHKYNLEPHWLEIELTETTFIEDIESAITALDNLNKLGVQLTIDDFGIKYSSFSYLKHFKIKKIKLDKSFIADIHKHKSSEAIIQSIIRLAHLLNFQVVAEGVESQPQVDFLKEHHCDQIQGFYISKPLSFEKMTAFLREKNES